MSIHRTLIGLLAFYLAGTMPSFCAELVELARVTKPAVVYLSISDTYKENVSSGTGFIVSADGRVVTNWHVVEHATKIEATLSDGRKVPIQGLLAKDKANDIAIIKAEMQATAEEVLTLASGSQVIQPGERVFVVGSPKGLSGTVSEGIVSAIRPAKDLAKFFPDGNEDIDKQEPLIQITAAISPGSSGSPVLNAKGEVVGVAASHVNGQNLNFAVAVGVVHKLIEKIPADAKLSSYGDSYPWWNLLISAAFFYGIYLLYKRTSA